MKEIGQELSCSVEAASARVKQTNDSLKDTLRRQKRLREEIADYTASRILEKAKTGRATAEEPLIAALVREEDSTNDMDFLTSVQGKIKDRLKGVDTPYILALAQSGHSTPSPDGCLLIFGSDDTTVNKVADRLKKGKTKFGQRLKGGGKGRWQGKLIEGRFKKEQDEITLDELLRQVF